LNDNREKNVVKGILTFPLCINYRTQVLRSTPIYCGAFGTLKVQIACQYIPSAKSPSNCRYGKEIERFLQPQRCQWHSRSQSPPNAPSLGPEPFVTIDEMRGRN
jgi:hypothetical protein